MIQSELDIDKQEGHLPAEFVRDLEQNDDYFNSNKEEKEKERVQWWQTIICACLLFIGGIALIITGAVLFWEGTNDRGLDMFIVGWIMLLPGSYGMSLVIGHLRGLFGYESDRVPLFDLH